MAGYTGTPLPGKLGIRPGMRVAFVNAPDGYIQRLGKLPEVTVLSRPGKNMDWLQLFCARAAELHERLTALRDALARDGMLWVSWPKKSSGMRGDLGESAVRRAGLVAGLVDVKICAVDETWSGLRFVFRLEDRRR